MFEKNLIAQGMGPKTTNWHELEAQTVTIEDEELLLRNTYVNA